MQQTQPLTQSLVEEDWASLSVLLNRINLSNIENKELRTKSSFIKNILKLHMSRLNGRGEIEASLLVGSIKTLLALEKEFKEEHGFIVFLKMLVYKMEMQSLVVDKVLEKQLEFKRMKRVKVK
jgi:hypothetical protein